MISDSMTRTGGLFGPLSDQPLDAMLTLLQLLRSDPRSDKIDLGIGVYGDETGATPVMKAVKRAERHLVETQDSKAYVAPEGDKRFLHLLAPLIFGETLAKDPTLTGMQTPGGTGALRLAASLIKKANPEARIWLGMPTWANHPSLMAAAGLTVLEHPFFDKATQTVLFDAMIATLDASARGGDILLLHSCCHNPTGAEFTTAQWRAIGDLCLKKGLVPLIDAAYQGLGLGLEADAAHMRDLIARLPEALIACSNSKNFGLYRERIGSVWIKGQTEQSALRARANMILIARSLWSMPPDHGAAIVRTILESDGLTTIWLEELAQMRTRIGSMRTALATALPQISAVAEQTGLFSLLPLSREAVVALRNECGIYMVESGRINVAGLNPQNLPVFASALEPYLN